MILPPKLMEKFFFILLIWTCIYSSVLHAGKQTYLPQTPTVSDRVYTMSLSNLQTEEQLAVLSLQGLVNREKGKIYLKEQSSEWLFRFYLEKGIIAKEFPMNDIYELLSVFRDKYKGVVIYNPANRYEVNLATNIAGVQNRIMLTRDMLNKMQTLVDKRLNIFDIRDLGLKDIYDAFDWYEKNIFPDQTHEILSVAKDLPMYNIFRDYLIQFRIPVFWLPGQEDTDYDEVYDNKIRLFLKNTPSNIPVLGFWAGLEHGKEVGYGEFAGVRLAGMYGKFTLVNTWVGNYSFHSGVTKLPPALKQEQRKHISFRKFNPHKKYIALIMIESGDAPAYFQYDGFFLRQWNDPERGSVPLSYGLTPSLRYLLPGLLDEIYKTATSNDYFFCSISGIGYCYPFEGYATKTPNSDEVLKNYFEQTATEMASLDMNMLGLYTHLNSIWTDNDYKLVRKYILPMPGLRSIISGMNKVAGYTSSNGNEMLNGVTVHHTLTIWSDKNFVYNNPDLDQDAVNYLAEEITRCDDGGNFIQAMFYSWQYGPRRLRMLQQQLEKEGYEFVALDEFDYLYRRAVSKKDLVCYDVLEIDFTEK